MVTFNGRSVWVIEDSSNPDKIREVDTLGRLLTSFEVSEAKNRDWEALTTDSAGHLYIGDFGNNNNRRKNLKIYKLPDPRVEKGDKIKAESIEFSYPDQADFPPPKSRMRFDAEALFHFRDSLYIITKNRTVPFDGKADVYRVPDEPGAYQAEWLAAITLCPDQRSCQVTDAALSPDGTRLVLLGYGTLWTIDAFSPNPADWKPVMYALGASTQLEAICFVTDSLLYLADERRAGTGGNVYILPLPEVKASGRSENDFPKNESQ